MIESNWHFEVKLLKLHIRMSKTLFVVVLYCQSGCSERLQTTTCSKQADLESHNAMVVVHER